MPASNAWKEREQCLSREDSGRDEKREMEYLVLTIPANVFYATGYIPLIGSTIAVVPADGFIP